MCERNIDWLRLAHTPPGDQTHNPDMCPDQESNWRPFALQADAQPAEPPRSEPPSLFVQANLAHSAVIPPSLSSSLSRHRCQ